MSPRTSRSAPLLRGAAAPVEPRQELLVRAFAPPRAHPSFDVRRSWRGRRVVAIGHTTIELAAVPELEKAFGGPTAGDGKRSGPPQARVVTLVECGTSTLLDAELGHYLEAENAMAARLVGSITPGMLVVAEGPFSGWLWTLFTEAGAALVWGVRDPIGTRIVKRFPGGSYLARFGRRQLVTVHVIEYTRAGSDEVCCLLTNLLDPDTAPTLELAVLHAERREVETVIAQIEARWRAGGALRSTTEVDVRHEFGQLVQHTGELSDRAPP